MKKTTEKTCSQLGKFRWLVTAKPSRISPRRFFEGKITVETAALPAIGLRSFSPELSEVKHLAACWLFFQDFLFRLSEGFYIEIDLTFV